MEITVNNFIDVGSVRLLKKDSLTGEALAGAEFKLLSSNGSLVSTGHITNTSGELIITGLIPGKYQLIEVVAPTGYEIDQTPQEFEIIVQQQTRLELEMTNSKIPEIPKAPKTGTNNTMLSSILGIIISLTLISCLRKKSKLLQSK